MFVYYILRVLPIIFAQCAAQYPPQMLQMPQFQQMPQYQQAQQMPQYQQAQQMQQLQQTQQMRQQPYPFYSGRKQQMVPMQNGMQPPMTIHMPRLPGPRPPIDPNQYPPVQLPMPGGRLPMVVVPHHSKSKIKRKKSKKHRTRSANKDFDSDESSDLDSSLQFSGRRSGKSSRKKRRQVLTPVVSYLTKDGYVVFQKKIKKQNAKDWLEMKQSSDDKKDKYNSSKKSKKYFS